MFLSRRSNPLPSPERALKGRAEPIPTADEHFIFGRPLKPPYPVGLEAAYFALGCFWGAERLFWQLPGTGIYTTAVGYAGGFTPNPTYKEVCTGETGHTEVVLVVFDPKQIAYADLLKTFWESHDPTQGNRQGNDVGTQYRSAIYTTTPNQLAEAEASRSAYEKAIVAMGYGKITTEVCEAPPFYFAEEDHQQYLGKVPNGYCGLKGTGVSCPRSAAQGAAGG